MSCVFGGFYIYIWCVGLIVCVFFWGGRNHASNAYMLHALGITHVVSVGECALVPPPHVNGHGHGHGHGGGGLTAAACHRASAGAHFIAGKGPGGQGSLWIEEREGRIKVMDIKGVCDDGIDTLEPQLEPICEWIDKARAEGGQVLVHCRVGVSRSATVTVSGVFGFFVCWEAELMGFVMGVDRVCDEAPWVAACGCVLDCAVAPAVGVDPAEYAVVV